ncbi:MAG: Eco57I restriction-modification methylase domain-containing protein [Cellulophaga sp.]
MKNLLSIVLHSEEKLISTAIQREFISDEIKPTTEKEIHLINANLLLTDQENLAFRIHKSIMNSLITIFLKSKFSKNESELKTIFNFEETELINNIVTDKIELIPNLIEEFHIAFLNSQFSIQNHKLTRKKSKHYLKEIGAVYTLKTITSEIVRNTINKTIEKDKSKITCLDFASGTGRFYFEAIKILNKEHQVNLKTIVCENLHAVDVDEIALSVLRCKVTSLFTKLDTDIINALKENIICRNALIPNTTLIPEYNNSINLQTDFKTVFLNKGFDAIFSNPPYYLLKANKKNSSELNGYFVNLQNKIKNELNFFKKSGVYNYSIEGMLNYYQLSIEMIIRLTKEKGQIGIICPSSLFADLTSTKLRKHLINSNKLHFIRYYSEASNLFENVAQSTVIFYLQKGNTTNEIDIEFANEAFKIDLKTVQTVFPKNQELPLIDELGWKILSKLSKHQTIKNLPYIRNKRGELDLTLFKEFITKENTGWRLIRGNMISESGIIDKNKEYVDIEPFINKKSNEYKLNDYKKERLICQQISNVDLKKRLKFTFSETTDIMANSCNYITSLRDSIDLQKLHFILNSELLNWRFKVTSSNNHINNYEIDEFPIINLDNLDLDMFSEDKDYNNQLICELYGLNKKETTYILGKLSIKKEIKILENEVI